MAIQLLFNVIAAKQDEIDAKYPGGFEQFKEDSTQREPRYLADKKLIAYGSMGDFLEEVIEQFDRYEIKFATGDMVTGFDPECDWIESGSLQGVLAFWLKGHDPGEVVEFIPRDTVEMEAGGVGTGRKWWQFWKARNSW